MRENGGILNATVARSLIHSLPENFQARRARVDAYNTGCSAISWGIELIRHSPGSACLTQVVRIVGKENGEDLAARIIAALGQAGFEVQGSYMPIHLLTHVYAMCVGSFALLQTWCGPT